MVAPPYLYGADLAPSVNDNLVRSEFSSPGLAFCTFSRNTLRTPASLIFNGKARYFPHRSRPVYVHRVRCISRCVCTFAHLFAHTLEGVRLICFTQVAAGSFGTFPRRSRNAFYHAVYRATVFGLRVGVCTLALYTRLNRRCTTDFPFIYAQILPLCLITVETDNLENPFLCLVTQENHILVRMN